MWDLLELPSYGVVYNEGACGAQGKLLGKPEISIPLWEPQDELVVNGKQSPL